MYRYAYFLLSIGWVFLATPAWSLPFSFTTGLPDGRMAAASRPFPSPEIEAGDDFFTTSQTKITSASFWGLLTGSTVISGLDVEIYHVFPKDSVTPPDNRVPTRMNSPSDNAFATRDIALGELTFSTTSLGTFTAGNSVLNGIFPKPNQTTMGEGPVTGTEVRFDVTFTSPFDLPADHYFFVPQVAVDGGNFYWLSTVGNNPPLFTGDLQAWIRNSDLDPDWLRIGTDIEGLGRTFNMAFSLAGTAAVPEPSTLLLLGSGLAGLVGMAWRQHRHK
jgi:PEP-CTERM motif-containing protein